MTRIILIAAACIGLAACTTAQQARTASQVDADLARAREVVETARVAYGVAKGMAAVAVTARPDLGPQVAAAETAIDAAFATADLAITSSTATAADVAALVAQVTAQVQQLTVTAAPAVRVVASR